MFYGGYILRFLGTVVIYLCQAVISLIKRKSLPSFRKIWSGSYDNNFYASVASELQLKLVGIAFLVSLYFMLYLIFYIKYNVFGD